MVAKRPLKRGKKTAVKRQTTRQKSKIAGRIARVVPRMRPDTKVMLTTKIGTACLLRINVMMHALMFMFMTEVHVARHARMLMSLFLI